MEDFPVPLAERLLKEVRVEIARADSKAAVLVAALGLGTGLFGGVAANGDWSPGSLPAGGQALWWLGVAALMVALTAFLAAVAPRYGPRPWSPGDPLSYFGDIHRAAGRGQLRQALAATNETPQRRLIHALEVNSRVASVKLGWVRLGLVAFAAAMLLVPAALLTA